MKQRSSTPGTDTLDRRVGPALGEVREFVSAREMPDLTAPVMHRIRQLEAHGRPAPLLARLARALWAPRPLTIRWRPVYALVVMAALLAPIVAGWRLPSDPAPPAAPDRAFLVQFRLETPNASEVRLAGTFTGWEPRHALDETTPGVWTIMLPLPDGVHDYAFVVDGQQWVPDPHAPRVSDGFGGSNSRLALLPPVTEPQS